MSDDGGGNLWVVGVVLVLAGSLGQNLGNNIVSLAHAKKKESIKTQSSGDSVKLQGGVGKGAAYAPDDDSLAKMAEIERDMEKNDAAAEKDGGAAATTATAAAADDSSATEQAAHTAMWYLGTGAFVVGSLSTFAAFGFAAQSLLAALESIQFVSNVVFAKYVHGEAITTRMMLATLSIVGGNVLVVIFSSHVALVLTSDEIIYLYMNNAAFWGYAACTFVIWAAGEYIFYTYHNARVHRNQRLWNHGLVEPLAYVVSSAIIGAVAVLYAKCLSMLIQVSARGIVNETILAPFYICLVIWILFVAYWLRRLDGGLELFPPLFFIPVIQVAFVFFAIVIGGIFFEEFNTFTWEQWLGFTAGVVMILAGVYGLAPSDVDVLSVQGHEAAVHPVDFDPSIDAAVGRAVSPDSDAVSGGLPRAAASSGGAGLAAASDAGLSAPALFAEKSKPAAAPSAQAQAQAPATPQRDAAAEQPAFTPTGAGTGTGTETDGATPGSSAKPKSARKVVKHGEGTPTASGQGSVSGSVSGSGEPVPISSLV